jgi:hypothetical protein
MAIDTLVRYVGVCESAADAEDEDRLVMDLHTEADLIDAYDAAVVELEKHETPTRVGGVLVGGVVGREGRGR